MRIRPYLLSLSALLALSVATDSMAAAAIKPTRTITMISSAGARAMADACTAWAEKNNTIVAMAILDWGGNVVESHAMEGAAPNAIATALLKARNALRWRRQFEDDRQALQQLALRRIFRHAALQGFASV